MLPQSGGVSYQDPFEAHHPKIFPWILMSNPPLEQCENLASRQIQLAQNICYVLSSCVAGVIPVTTCRYRHCITCPVQHRDRRSAGTPASIPCCMEATVPITSGAAESTARPKPSCGGVVLPLDDIQTSRHSPGKASCTVATGYERPSAKGEDGGFRFI